MALLKCKECGSSVSSSAKKCLNCGKPTSPQTSWMTWTVLTLIIFGGLVSVTNNRAKNDIQANAPSTQQTAVPTVPLSAAQKQANKKNDEERMKKKLDEIEDRLSENNKYMQKYYARDDQLQKANEDYLWVFATETATDSNLSKSIVKKALALKPKIEQQARKMYASVLEHKMMDARQDISFSAKGKENKTLYVKWVLMGNATAYNFHKEIAEKARGYGFTKVVYTDGYNETWTYDLRS
ncbi:MAG: zinc ribbon domain-containing protein [Sulfurovaceae bacterium]|nr:zinc ribbon domain-containing protein [Sulfurovaceae bacterium]